MHLGSPQVGIDGLFSYDNRVRANRFRPGQASHTSFSHLYVTTKIQPVIENHISSKEEYAIQIFDALNSIFLITFSQLFQWLGVWNLLSYYVWPWEDYLVVRDAVYFGFGIFLTALSVRFFGLDDNYTDMTENWENGVPPSFGWKRKIKSYLRKTFSFIAYGFVWVGAWDYIDTQLITEDIVRDTLFVVVPIFILFFLEELFSPESLYYMAARIGKDNYSPPSSQKQKNCCCPFFLTHQPLYPSQDPFIRQSIQPAVSNYISPCQDWTISIFSAFNSILLVTVVQLFQWVGMWDLFSYYVWPYDETTYRDLLYTSVGFIGMYLSTRFFNSDQSAEDRETMWLRGLPKSFCFKRKIVGFSREMFSFIGFLFVWVGVWDFLDTKLWESSLLRDSLYAVVTLLVSFVLEEVLATESLFYWAAQRRRSRSELLLKNVLNTEEC